MYPYISYIYIIRCACACNSPSRNKFHSCSALDTSSYTNPQVYVDTYTDSTLPSYRTNYT